MTDIPTPLKFTVSKETTLFIEPLRLDGRVDYLQVMNDRLGHGVTPENNAAVELIQALGPGFLPEESRKEVLARLGLPELPETGDYLTNIWEFHKIDISPKDAEGNDVADGWKNPFFTQLEFTEEHPWSKEEYPQSAAWIDANERNFQILMAGSQKERFYIPLVNEKGNFFLTAMLSSALDSRNISYLFRRRALNELHSDRLEEAWRIILAGYRWARLLSHGPLQIDYMLATGMANIADSTLLRLISFQNLTAKQTSRYIADLDRLPPWPSAKDVFFYGERFDRLDYYQELATNGWISPPEEPATPEGDSSVHTPEFDSLVHSFLLQQQAMKRLVGNPRLDWNEAFRYFHERHKPFLDAWECSITLERLKRMGRAEKNIPSHPDNVETILKDDFPSTAAPTELAQCFVEINDYFGFHLVIAWMELERAVRFDLCRIAFALTGYRSDHGRYPAALAELCPGYLAAVPNDPFSGQPLIYKPEKDNYVIYSVGPNQRDDGGRHFRDFWGSPGNPKEPTEEERSYDDIVLRMPIK